MWKYLEALFLNMLCMINNLTMAALYSKLSWKLFIEFRYSKVHCETDADRILMHLRISKFNK